MSCDDYGCGKRLKYERVPKKIISVCMCMCMYEKHTLII